MEKIAFVEKYIEKCNSTTFDHENLISEIVFAFSNDINNIGQGLSFFGYGGSTDGDLLILKAVLTNYKCNLQREDKIRADELKQLELKNQITINTNNTSNSNSSATAIATVTITQTMKNINELPEGILNKEESIDLKELIHSIDEMIAVKDKEGAKSKISKVLSTIGNKGFDIFVAVAPYLIQAAGIIQTTS